MSGVTPVAQDTHAKWINLALAFDALTVISVQGDQRRSWAKGRDSNGVVNDGARTALSDYLWSPGIRADVALPSTNDGVGTTLAASRVLVVLHYLSYHGCVG